MWGMIATWRMALEGVTEAATALASGATLTRSGDSVTSGSPGWPSRRMISPAAGIRSGSTSSRRVRAASGCSRASSAARTVSRVVGITSDGFDGLLAESDV